MKLLVQTLSIALSVFLGCALPTTRIPDKNQVVLHNDLIDAKELEMLLDLIFAEQMEKLRVPGAVISVVSNGKIIFTKGYGVADVEKKTPVVPSKTIWRLSP